VADIPMIYNKSHTIISNDTTDYFSASMREQLAPSNRPYVLHMLCHEASPVNLTSTTAWPKDLIAHAQTA